MKNFAFLLILLLLGSLSFAQQKSGTVYSKHDVIDKTHDMWDAFVDGNEEKFMSFLADSMMLWSNGERNFNKVPRENLLETMKWWHSEFDHISVKQDKPSAPDAIEYDEYGMFVFDWIKFSGVSKSSGIILDLPFHNIYWFDNEGKIKAIDFYFNDDIFEEITNSQTTKKNGVVYINHPYIVKVRKMLNAVYINRDAEEWASYFSPKATYRNSAMKIGETLKFDELKEMVKKSVNSETRYKLKQVGYPDCVYYEKNNTHVVYAWWNRTTIEKDKKYVVPIMTSHTFNKEGKIVNVMVYMSTNHSE